MRRLLRLFIIAMAVPAMGGCHVQWLREHPLGCHLDQQSMIRDTLYLGSSIPGGGSVDEAAWNRFTADVLTPAFPRGYTVLDGRGVWRNAHGGIDDEVSRLVIVVHADDAASNAALAEVVSRYRTDFRQESVLRERSAVCVEF